MSFLSVNVPADEQGHQAARTGGVGYAGIILLSASADYREYIEAPLNSPLVASGGEGHIVIGSFRDDASTSTVPGPGLWPGGAYYYIDDLSVEVLPAAEEACRISDNSCTMQFPGECTLIGGPPAGSGTTCTPNPCEPTKTQPTTWGAVKTIHR